MLQPNQSQAPGYFYHDEFRDLLGAIEPHVRDLLSSHLEKSARWMPHEILPWGEGEDFVSKPWRAEQSRLRPEIALALETHLLTEDNLPYYHAIISSLTPEDHPLHEWSGIWTSEEATHSAVIRDYIHLTRALDPEKLERNRVAFMRYGFKRSFATPLDVFAYTSAQELATRISHLAVGQKAEDPTLLKVLTLVARDENFHFIFYRAVVKRILELAPEAMLTAIMRQLYSFDMPGAGMDQFDQRAAIIAREGIFGATEFRDSVVKPLLSFWDVEHLRGLSPQGERAQERLMRLERVLDRMVEKVH